MDGISKLPPTAADRLGISLMALGTTRRNVMWALFSVSVMAAWLLGERGWMLHWWLEACRGLALVTVILGAMVIRIHERRVVAAVLVGVGLIIGNWRLLEGAAMIAIWSIRGFAP